MTVYHGSTCEIRVPDLSRSKRNIDFGPGFYVTVIRRQAERWAMRKAARLGGKAIVNVFSMSENWDVCPRACESTSQGVIHGHNKGNDD